MKKYLFWITFPALLLLFVIFYTLQGASEIIVGWIHEYEGWCLDYAKKYKGMKYKGRGVWTSAED